jgi:hypothetical protein
MSEFPWNMGDDFTEVVDHLTPVTLVRRDGSPTVEVPHALRRVVKTREAQRSAGRYMANDAVWHLSRAELSEPPCLGDRILDVAGRAWTILEVQSVCQGTRWRCATRNLVIACGLDQTIEIEQATFTKKPSGAMEPVWQTWRTGLAARIQPRKAKVDGQQGRLETTRRFTVFLAENVPVSHTHRIRGPYGTVYRILASRRAERIDALMEIDVVRID